MSHKFLPAVRALLVALAAVTSAAVGLSQSAGQAPDLGAVAASAVQFRVQSPTERMEMIVNTSRILTLDKKIPRIQVNNPDIISARPLSPSKIQMAALRPGVTQINLWDEDEKIYTVDVIVFGDARELQMLLESEFPNASLKVRPLASSVVISGYVDRPESVSRIVRMSEDYYPKVINNITVGGVQQVLLHVRVLEVSRSKLRQVGIDWAEFNGNDFFVQRAAGILAPPEMEVGAGITGALEAASDTMRFGIVDGANAFFGFVDALRVYNLAKLLAEPTLVTVSGRPASFNVGGEFPILVPGGLGTVSIEYKQFGTRVDFVPIVLGNGNIRLEVRPAVTERDDASGVNGVPAIRSRWVDTAAEMKAGQTLALAGLVQHRVEAENRGVPWAADLPWIGSAFRRVQHRINEVELLVLVTPELVGAMDPHEVPHCLPGDYTTTPCDLELFGKGYLEVPKCCDGCYGAQYIHGAHLQGAPIGGCTECGQPMPVGQFPDAPANGDVVPGPDPIHTSHIPRAARRQNGVPASYNRQNHRAPTPDQGVRQATANPGLIGPVGYDVLD